MLKRAAVLLFHEDPERWFTGAHLRIGRFRSDADLLFHNIVTGGLLVQQDKGLELVLDKYLTASISYEGMQRVERYPVPPAALREAIVNALIHKDYSSGTPVQISVYDNKLMIYNPGSLPMGWTVDTLLEKHSSEPRNPDLAGVFFRLKLVESWGRGYARIADACRANGTPLPTLRHEGPGLWIEWQWDAASDPVSTFTDPVTGHVASHAGHVGPEIGHVAGHVAGHVTEHVETLLRLLSEHGESGPSDIRARLGLTSRPHVHSQYVQPALAAGLIEMTIPDKPKSRLQKYRLTTAGRAALAPR